MSDINLIQLIDANTICLGGANVIALGTAAQTGGAGLPLERKKKSRKEKKRDRKRELEQIQLRRELERQAIERQREAEESEAKSPKRKPKRTTVIKFGDDVSVEDVKAVKFVPAPALSDNLLLPGETSGFIRDAIEREQAEKEFIRQTELSQQILEENRLRLLADDEQVIALYLLHEQDLIRAYLENLLITK
jgi:hypothetical protein